MKVTRKMQFKTNDIYVGDQITVKLKGFGKFTATAQKVTDKGVLFFFDEVIAIHCMNESRTNEGGFEASDMKRWLENVILNAFPEKFRGGVTDISLPSFGQIFGHDNDDYKYFEPDDDEQFESMKRRGNRVCDFNDDWVWWWLRNATKKDVSSAYFADVGNLGNATSNDASDSGGVRPVFWLVR